MDSHILTSHYGAPLMLERGWGRIVNVTTKLDTMNRAGSVPYGPSKAALEMASEIWAKLQTMLDDQREQRLAYLLYHCGLSPREIVRFYPQEWSDVLEIHGLRRAILERLLRNASQLSLEA